MDFPTAQHQASFSTNDLSLRISSAHRGDDVGDNKLL